MSFQQQTFDYLADLTVNNNKAWFDANRDRYDVHWLEPAKQFVTDWAGFMGDLTPPHKAAPKLNGSIRRINRDVRFSKDKRPYDPKLHLVFWCGDHPNKSPALHVVIHHDHLGMGAGQWMMSKAELDQFRQAVIEEKTGRDLVKIVAALEKRHFSLTAPALKRLPADMPADTGRDHLLKRKGLVVTTGDHPLPLSLLDVDKQLRGHFKALARLNEWLCLSQELA